MFNTGQGFHINTTYDLFSVAMHEIGHSLGLGESSVAGAVEYGTYNGVMKGLASDDIAGIRSIYSSNAARTPDAYNVGGGNNGSVNMATWINGMINSTTLTALVPNLDITTAGQSEYFAFTPPYGGTGTLDLDVQSSGLSLLAPKVTVYASNGSTVLASANGAGQYGTTLNVTVPNMVVGQTYYVLVQGADTTQMGTGRYALGVNFNGKTPPTEASPIVTVPDGNPLHTCPGQADGTNGKGPYVAANPVITGISPDNGVSSQDGVTNNPQISIQGTAPALNTVTVYLNGQAIGQTIATAFNTWSYNNAADPLSDGSYAFTAMATDWAGFSTAMSYAYGVTIDTHTPQPPQINGISPDTGPSGTNGVTNFNRPTFSGATEPFAVVNLYLNGSNKAFGTTEADAYGNWSYTVGQPGQMTYPGGAQGSVALTVNSLLGGTIGESQTGGSGQSLADGTYSVTATAMDVAGTVSQASVPMTIVIDTKSPSAPKVTGISPDTGSSSTDGITTAQNLMISGTAQAGNLVVVLLNGTAVGSVVAGSNGAWTFDDTATTLPDGTYAITAVTVDVAGNISNVSGTFNATIETVAQPAIAGVSLVTQTHAHTSQQELSASGTAAPNDQVQVTLGGQLLGTVNANGQGAWSYTYVPASTTVADGTYDFSAAAVDQSGNISAASPMFRLQVGSGPTAGTPQYVSGVLSGQATPGSQVTIVDGDIVLGIVTADASGNWQFGHTLAKGQHTIMADAANSSGDTSLLSGALSVKI